MTCSEYTSGDSLARRSAMRNAWSRFGGTVGIEDDRVRRINIPREVVVSVINVEHLSAGRTISGAVAHRQLEDCPLEPAIRAVRLCR